MCLYFLRSFQALEEHEKKDFMKWELWISENFKVCSFVYQCATPTG